MSQDRQIKILIIEEFGNKVSLLCDLLSNQTKNDFLTEQVSRLDDVILSLQKIHFDAVLIDLDTENCDGLEVISEILSYDPTMPIVVTGVASNENFELDTMHLNVHEYLRKGQYGSVQLASTLNFAIENKKNHHLEELRAHYDQLTGLANRALFYSGLEEVIAISKQADRMASLLLINLDDFSQINKKNGSLVGDEALKQTALRLKGCISKYKPSSQLYHLGSDDFAVILDSVNKPSEVTFLAEKINACLSRKMEVNVDGSKQRIRVTASLGLAFYPLCADARSLSYSAEIALFRAKHAKAVKGNFYKIYTKELSQEDIRKYSLEAELEFALEKEQFHLYYQPQVNLHTGELMGLEALLRWNHPKLDLLYPGAFIEQIETSEQGWDLTEWVLNIACRHLKSWHSFGNPNLKMDINISPFQLRDPELVSKVRKVLKKTDLEAKYLELELTERQPLPQSVDICHRNIRALRELGVCFAVDDYGTGNNSDSCLRQFPENTFSTIKIDRSYVKEITTNATTANCIKRDIDFAHKLGMQVIAEGVEKLDQLRIIKDLGADIVQGFVVSEAVPAPLLADDIYKGNFDLDRIYERNSLATTIH